MIKAPYHMIKTQPNHIGRGNPKIGARSFMEYFQNPRAIEIISSIHPNGAEQNMAIKLIFLFFENKKNIAISITRAEENI